MRKNNMKSETSQRYWNYRKMGMSHEQAFDKAGKDTITETYTSLLKNIAKGKR